MDKTEALEFIGLKEPITEKAVEEKYTERFNYFQMLYTNAPSKVVEKIQQQNLEKLKRFKRQLLDEISLKRNNFEKIHPKPIVTPEVDVQKIEKKPVVGWLISHMEDKKVETFDLLKGINYIGRTKKDDGANNIVIENDRFISRTHAFIKCKESHGTLQFMLYDGDGSKPSANGIFLNGNKDRLLQSCFLKENDTVQVGVTKLVFKIKKDHRSISGEVEEVMGTGFIPTIEVSI